MTVFGVHQKKQIRPEWRYAGKPHARFDEGEQGETCSLLYPFMPFMLAARCRYGRRCHEKAAHGVRAAGAGGSPRLSAVAGHFREGGTADPRVVVSNGRIVRNGMPHF